MARKKYKKRSDGRYETTVKIGVNPDTGRPIRTHIYAYTVKELEKKRGDYIKKVKEGLVCDRPVSFGEYAEKWFKLNKSGKAANTRAVYANTLKKHIGCIRNKRIDCITKSDIQLQLNQAAGHHSTQEIVLLTIRQVLDCAVDDGLIIRNPSQNIRLDPEKGGQKKRQLTDFELDCIAAADLEPEERCFISLLLYTGMRRGEIFALSKSSIDLEAGVIHVNRTAIYATRSRTEITPPKSNAGFRDIPILMPLRPVLIDFLVSLDTEYLFARKNAENGKYELLTDSQVATFWKHIYQKLNETAKERIASGKCNCNILPPLSNPMQGITPHYFRHNFATILYYAGVDVKDAARILGHSNVNTTLRIYTHLDQEKSASADKLNQYLKEG